MGYPVLAALDEEVPGDILDEVGVGVLDRDTHVPIVERAREVSGAESARDLGSTIQGPPFRVHHSGLRVQGSGRRVREKGCTRGGSLGLRVEGRGCEVRDSGLRA